MTHDTQADAGAQPAPAHQPKTLRELAEDVKDCVTNQAWPHPDPDCDDIAIFGHINEDGVDYPVAEVNADTYGHEGLSLQLAQFYAAAHPAAVLALMDRIAELEAQAAAKCLNQVAEPAPVTYMATDNACKWAWDQVREEVGTEGWTAGDSCTFYGFFLWGWNYRGQYETQRPAAPPAPAAVAVTDERQEFERYQCDRMRRDLQELTTHVDGRYDCDDIQAEWEVWQARAALAAAPAQAQDDRAAFKAYLQECDDCEIVPDVAGAFHAAWQKRAAPAQAVAVPQVFPLQGDESDEDDLSPWQAGDSKPATEGRYLRDFDEGMAISWFSGGEWTRDGFFASDIQDAPWRGLSKPAAPAQEHATQLAGQVSDAAYSALQYVEHALAAIANREELVDGAIERTDTIGKASKRAKAALTRLQSVAHHFDAEQPAAPAEAQEDARDAERVEWAMNNMVVHRHSRAFAVHVLNRGGTGDLGDCRTYIDAARAAQGGRDEQ